MISFDVTSLFTKVPLDEAMEAITEKLTSDETLDKRTPLSMRELCQLMNLCLRSTYFQFRDAFYEQLEGATMGSPLSPVVANLYMEMFEEKALRSATLRPRMWVRYVDDTFAIWPHGTEELNRFHDHLNDQHPAIQFTREEEADKRIPFLDTLVEQTGSVIKTSVYRKPTNTDHYIHYSSHHQRRVLRGTLCSMRDRAHNLCRDIAVEDELTHLTRVFESNGYPSTFIRQVLDNPPTKRNHTVSGGEKKEEASKPKVLYLPYYVHG